MEQEDYSLDFPTFMKYVGMVLAFISVFSGCYTVLALNGYELIGATLIGSGIFMLFISAVLSVLIDIRDKA